MTQGVILVNGKPITKLGSTVDPEKDKISVHGKLVSRPVVFTYIAVNKPIGIVSSRSAQGRDKTIYDLVPGSRPLAIAGRLDKDSEGLVILTNDGELVHRLTHPRFQHEKEYVVETSKSITASALNKLRRGVRLDEGVAMVDSIVPHATATYRLVLHQGWKRQIRRMIGAVRNDVRRLKRTRIGRLELGPLKTGGWRAVKRSEIL